MKKINPLIALVFLLAGIKAYGQDNKKIILSYDKSGCLVEKKTPSFNIQDLIRPTLPTDSATLPHYAISPVPSNDVIQVSPTSNFSENILSAELYSLSGQLIEKFDCKAESKLLINVADITTGMYVLVLMRSHQHKEIHKIIIND